MSRRGLLRFDVRQARLVSKADRVDNGIDTIQALFDQASAMLDQMEADGADVTEYRALLDQGQAMLDAINENGGGLGDDIAGITAAEGAGALLDEAAAALEEAAGGLETLNAAIAQYADLLNPPAGDGGAPNVN